MAFNIHWQIPFYSLRTGVLYTVNIYDSAEPEADWPIILKGAAQPFVTKEDTGSDVFKPIRTQSGYIRIIDDGKATKMVSGEPVEISFDWSDLLPTNDIDRPVTLTHPSGANTVTDWQGFMQGQNFNGTLYGGVQEREFPIQCMLASTGTDDIVSASSPVKTFKNFAYYIKLILDYIKSITVISGNTSAITFDYVYVQGGTTARDTLLNQIDPQAFIDIDADENTLEAKYTKYQVLEDICRYFGFSVRTYGKSVFFMCVNGSSTDFWRMSAQQLNVMANGNNSGANITVGSLLVVGNVFASFDNTITVHRGYSKAVIKADVGSGEDSILDCFPKYIIDNMPSSSERYTIGDYHLAYTKKASSISGIDMEGNSVGDSHFGTGTFYEGSYSQEMDDMSFLFVRNQYQSGAAAQVTLESVYERNFAGMYLELHADTYVSGKRIDVTSREHDYGDIMMKCRIGIGKTRNTAKWFVENNGSCGWSSTAGDVRLTICNKGDKLYYVDSNVHEFRIPVPLQDGYIGKLFIDFYGATETIPVTITLSSQGFFLVGFRVEKEFSSSLPLVPAGWESTTKEQTARNSNTVMEDFNANCIFSTYGKVKYGHGILATAEGSPLQTTQEQNLADRVAAGLGQVVGFWSKSRKIYTADLLMSNSIVNNITPQREVSIAGVTCLPIALSFDWWNSVKKVVLIEK